MKILASRADDVRRRREKWKAEYDQKKSAYEEKRGNFYKAQYGVLNAIKEEIEQNLARFDLLSFDVDVQTDWGEGIEARIKCNEHNKFEDTVALSWNYNASYFQPYGHDGKELKRETGSWSGLNAVTPEQMQSLRQSVEALEYLNSIDWKQMLDKTLPKYSDYIGYDDNPGKDRTHEFDEMEKVAQVEDVVGDGNFYAGKNNCYKFERATDSFFIVSVCPRYYCRNSHKGDYAVPENLLQKAMNWGTQRIKKATVISDLVFPLLKVETYVSEEE